MRLKSIIEGAWGSKPLDNDAAADWKWEIGKIIISEIESKLNGDDYNYKYYAIGMWEYIKKALYTQYRFFTTDMEMDMDKLVKKTCQELLDNPDKLINQYKNPTQIISYLKSIIK